MEGRRLILNGLCFSFCVGLVACHPDIRDLILKRRSEEGRIRLVGGRTEYQGRLEVFHDGRWGTVCDDNFDRYDARVACRQLGHSGGKVTKFASGVYGQGEGPTWMDNVSCDGGETRLVDCHFPGWEIEDCSHFEDVGIKCDQVEEGKLRLIGGATPLQGRLEIFHDERWGTVCDDGWTPVNSRIVCSQMGYSGGTVFEASDGSGTGAIWMDDVSCRGDEEKLMECNFPGWKIEDCSHYEDIMIACDPLEEGTVRLVGGQNEQEGRVEIVHNGKWGTVCDDGFGQRDARVVCRQLGYSGGRVAGEAAFGRGKGPIWMDQVTCSGNEQRLTECEYPGWRQEDCSHWEDVGVSCDPVDTLPGDMDEIESNNTPI